MGNQFEVIIIGSGAGGGTLFHSLAKAGKKVLLLERGKWLPREKANWDVLQVFKHDRYHASETWLDKKGKQFRPGTGYWVGGNTKVFGAALFRLREGDFERVVHKGGISPEWPLKYRDLAPYYARAEALYEVRGEAGKDPTEPPIERYPFPAVSHEPRIQEIADAFETKGLKPFHVPLGIRLDERDPVNSACIRCINCDGFPCLLHAKADSEVICVRPGLKFPHAQIATGAKVTRLLTSASGREVTGVEVETKEGKSTLSAQIVVVACGAINSAALLLASANDKHPKGLANGSDQVGRNFMKHNNGAIMAVSTRANPTQFQKTLAFNDLYWSDGDFKFPVGHVSLVGKVTGEMIELEAGFGPDFAFDKMAKHSVDWWLTTEDLPDPANRVRLEGERLVLEHTDNNTEAFDRLMSRWKGLLKEVDGEDSTFFPQAAYFRKKIPLQGVGHQCGTTRFGEDAKTSVLDLDCKAHELDNLYVVDGSFFPSSGAINPSLTIIANALRVGEHLLGRLG